MIGQEKFQSFCGIKSGSSLSCGLFIFYLDHTKLHGDDGFLKDTQLLLLIDDTVLLATCREGMMAKLTILHESATELGMVMLPTKSRFLAKYTEDKTPFDLETVKITNCE